MRWWLLLAVWLTIDVTAARAADFPYAVYVNSDDVYVRSGETRLCLGWFIIRAGGGDFGHFGFVELAGVDSDARLSLTHGSLSFSQLGACLLQF